MSPQTWAALAIAIITLVGVAVGKYPRLRMNRATIALVGAMALVVIGALSLDEAYAALDMNTLALLFAMMVINVNLRLSGFFRLVGGKVICRARSPRQLLALVVVASGVLSALFLNDTIVLMFTPMVLEMTALLGLNPLPYLIGLVTAANIGSAATIVGNPQNMIIGVSSGIPFSAFTLRLAPVALIGLVVVWAVIAVIYRRALMPIPFPDCVALHSRAVYRPLLQKALIATAFMLAAFLAGVPVALASLAAACALLVTRRLRPERVFIEIDLALLVFFAGLFVVTGAIETTGLNERLFSVGQPVAERGVAALSLVAVILSNLVSNVPAVLLFRPFIPQLADPQRAWLTLAMATTFAGNLTLLGSVANLIVAETAHRHGVELSFSVYLKSGVPITLISLALGVVWLSITP